MDAPAGRPRGRGLLGRLRGTPASPRVAAAGGGGGGAAAPAGAAPERERSRERDSNNNNALNAVLGAASSSVPRAAQRPLLALALVAGVLLLLADNGHLSNAMGGPEHGGGGVLEASSSRGGGAGGLASGGGGAAAAALSRASAAAAAALAPLPKSPTAPPAGGVPRRARLVDDARAAVAAASRIAADRAAGIYAPPPPPPAAAAAGGGSAAGGMSAELDAALDAAEAAAAAGSGGGVAGADGGGGEPGELRTNLPPDEPDAPLPPLSAELLQRYSNPVPGQARRAVVASFTDYKPSAGGSAAQAAQARMLLSWVRTARRLNVSCLVGICESVNPLRAGVAALADEDACGLFHAPRRECVVNPRVGRWYYVSDITSYGFDTFSSDPDVALLRNPLPYFGSLMAAHPQADVFATTDANNGIYAHAAGARGGGTGGGVVRGGGAYFHALLPSTEPLGAADAAAAAMPPTRWRAAFPALAALPQGYVARPEFAYRDAAFDADGLVAALASTRFELGLEDPSNCQPHQFNSGLMYWRATPRAAELLTRWRALLDVTSGQAVADDQLPINVVMKNASRFCAMSAARGDVAAALPGACGGDGMLNAVAGGAGCLGLLNLVQFANGFVFSTARAHETHGARPFALHATYSGDKLMKLREEGLLQDEPSYYDDGKERFLSYEVLLPADEFFHAPLHADAPAGTYTWRTHWALMRHQMAQLRAALAIATALGRTLVLPRVACTCECFFFPGKDCVIEGHRVRLPHVCPTDHWLRPGRLTQPHREPGFLDNPRLPAAVAASRATVAACTPDEGPDCVAGTRATPAAIGAANVTVHVPGGSTDAQLAAALAPLAAARVLHLAGGAPALFSHFADAAADAAFNASLYGILSAWCCLKTHPDGAEHPGVEVWKVPYKFEGEPEAVDGSSVDVGKCGA
jgi:hypothetical protein